MAAEKLSETQVAALRALDTLDGREDLPRIAARDVATVTGQSTDGAAYTLRSLIRRELAVIASHDGDAAGYRLTGAGRAQVQADADRQAADRERMLAWLRETRPESAG